MSTVRICSLLAILAVVAVPAWADPMGTTITYQGQLRDGGLPASGLYNIMFRVFDSPTSPTTIGGLSVGSLPVVNGLFSVDLDFGSLFTGTARWIEIRVQPLGAAEWTILSPRQMLNPVPYAVCASAVVPGAVTSTMLASEAESLAKVSGGTLQSVPAIPFVGVGRNTQVTGNEYFGVLAPTTTWGGMYVKTSGAAGLPYYGYAAAGSAHMAYHWMDAATGDWSLFNDAVHLTVKANGNVGIGTAGPTSPLHVAAAYTGSSSTGGMITAINTAVDVSDHVAIFAKSAQQATYGIGVKAIGGFVGVDGSVSNGGTAVQGWASGSGGSNCFGVTGAANGFREQLRRIWHCQ